MAYFLGFDVSKLKVDAALVNGVGNVLLEDKVTNKVSDITAFLGEVAASYDDDEIVCVVESTGCFHHPVVEAAAGLRLECRILNPIITRQQIKATIRGKKTDKTDAIIIARLGLRGEGRIYVPEPYLTTKYYGRSARKLTDLSKILKLHVRHLEELSGVDLTKEAKDALDEIESALNKARCQMVKDMTVAVGDDTLNLLQTIPGIGPKTGAGILGEIQDVRRFASGKALVAFAGLDPRVKQSGHTLNHTGRLTKRGSSYLRHTLFLSASVARRYDPSLNAFYEKKRSEGKSYTVAVCAVARKLLLIVRAVWLSGVAYDPNFSEKC